MIQELQTGESIPEVFNRHKEIFSEMINKPYSIEIFKDEVRKIYGYNSINNNNVFIGNRHLNKDAWVAHEEKRINDMENKTITQQAIRNENIAPISDVSGAMKNIFDFEALNAQKCKLNAFEAASKIPASSAQELLQNADKILKWLNTK